MRVLHTEVWKTKGEETFQRLSVKSGRYSDQGVGEDKG